MKTSLVLGGVLLFVAYSFAGTPPGGEGSSTHTAHIPPVGSGVVGVAPFGGDADGAEIPLSQIPRLRRSNAVVPFEFSQVGADLDEEFGEEE